MEILLSITVPNGVSLAPEDVLINTNVIFNLINTKYPEYLFNEIPAARQTSYNLRNQCMYSLSLLTRLFVSQINY